MVGSNRSPPPLDSLVLAQRLVDTLPPEPMPGLFNPWRDTCAQDSIYNTPTAKIARLAAHLDCNPAFILCGEAPGHLGCRHTGVAFTSESLLMDGSVPRISRLDHRLTTLPSPLKEQSATIVWKALYRLGIAETTVMWNALQLHPHQAHTHRSNRTPTDKELAFGAAGLAILLATFPNSFVLAVGRKAEATLKDLGIDAAATIRHPANGGAPEFNEGLAAFIRSDQ